MIERGDKMETGYIGNKSVWTKEDQKKIDEKYFKVIRITDRYCEIMSLNTKHCWIICKSLLDNKRPIILYHKHSLGHAYYHKHWEAFTISQAVGSIKNHDKYVLESMNQKEELYYCS